MKKLICNQMRVVSAEDLQLISGGHGEPDAAVGNAGDRRRELWGCVSGAQSRQRSNGSGSNSRNGGGCVGGAKNAQQQRNLGR